MRQRVCLGAREGSQTKLIIDLIPEMRSVSAEAECSPKQRQIELERVKSQSPACSRIMNTPPGSLLSSFEASRSSGNDSEDRLATAAFIPTLWGQHVVILHWEGLLMWWRHGWSHAGWLQPIGMLSWAGKRARMGLTYAWEGLRWREGDEWQQRSKVAWLFDLMFGHALSNAPCGAVCQWFIYFWLKYTEIYIK